MKTTIKFALASLTVALLSTSAALADSANWPSVNNVRPNVSQSKTTIAFGGSAKTSTKAPQANGQKTLKQINTAHGTALYFAE